MSFSNRVGYLVNGQSGYTTEITQWLADGVKDVVNRALVIRPDLATLFADRTALADANGSTLVCGMVVGVERFSDADVASFQARLVPYTLRADIKDVNSIHYASKYSPAYYVQEDKLFVFPIPTVNDIAYVDKVIYGAVNDGSESIANFPEKYYDLVVMFAAIRTLNAKLSDIGLPADPVFRDFPTLPTAPSISYSAADFSNVDTYIDTDEDIELGSARLSQVSVEIQDATATMQAAIQDYTLELQRYTSDVQSYSTDAQSELARYQAQLQGQQADYQWMAGRYVQLKQDYETSFAAMAPQVAQKVLRP